MPTNLSQLPSNLPVPGNRVQIKRGAADTLVNFNTATAAGTVVPDGAGGNMQISYTPRYQCYWIVHTNIMAHGYPDGIGWRRWDHGIYCTPADADGIVLGSQCPHEVYDNTSIEWRSVGTSFKFRLLPGITYTASLTHVYLTAGTVQVHTGYIWCRIIGRIVGEGST